MGKTHTELLQVRMSSDLKKSLEKLALERGKTPSEMIRDMICESTKQGDDNVQLTMSRKIQAMSDKLDDHHKVMTTMTTLLLSLKVDTAELKRPGADYDPVEALKKAVSKNDWMMEILSEALLK